MLLAKVWYFLSTGGQAFVLPYFNIYFDQLGFNKEQIGMLSALRPWLSAPCAVLLCSVADRFSCHTALLVFTFAASLFLRCLLLLVPAKFLAVTALVLLSDCIGAPVGAIVDATVVGACKSDGDYGTHRMWASAAWGGLSVVAGTLVAARGLAAGFAVYLVLSIPCLYIAFRIRKDAAAEKAASEVSAATACAGGDAASTSTKPKQQKQLTGTSGKEAATAVAGHEEDEVDELMTRLLPATPDSSCYGSYANSSCGGSRQCSPSPDMMRAASPFSRFCNKGFDAKSNPCLSEHQDLQLASTTVVAASPVAGAAVAGGTDGLHSTQEGSAGQGGSTAEAAVAGDAVLIKAWYDEPLDQAEGGSGEQWLEQQQLPQEAELFRDGPEFVPGPAEAALLDLQQQELHSASTAAVKAAGDAVETATSAVAVVGVAIKQSATSAAASAAVSGSNTAVDVATKQSARLEEKESVDESQQLLQPSYSLVDWQACSSPGPASDAAATERAAGAAMGTHPKNQCAPLLKVNTKQPLPTVSAADAACDAGAAAAEVTIRSLLVRPAVLVFMWRALIIGLGLGTIGNFLFLHVEELGGTGTLFGLMLCFNCITEVPAFMFQSTILEKLPVPFVFNASMLLLALRLAGYGVLPLLHCPWAVLVLELLHGFTFATSWGAGIVHCKRLAPPHLNASMQGLFSSLYGGVGSGLGALLGGVLMQALGGQALFFIASCVVLCGWLVGYLLEQLLVRPGTEKVNFIKGRGSDPNPASTAAVAGRR